jgi:hypothetical protein
MPSGREPDEFQFPAGADNFEGQISGEKLTALAGAAQTLSVTATLSSAGNLLVETRKVKAAKSAGITLKPVWRLIDAERASTR